jgi:hypothetical protein
VTDAPGRWNLQTIIALASVAGMLFAGGAVVNSLRKDTDSNSIAVERLTLGLERNDSATAQLDLRVQHVEAIASDAVKLRRELDVTLGRMQSDIAVIKSMLEKKGTVP